MPHRDRHHSQQVDAEPSESERMAETTLMLTLKSVDRHLTEQIKLTREMTTLHKALIAKTGNVEATLVLKAICEEVKAMRECSHVNEATLFAVCEVRDELRGLNGRADETNRLLEVLTTLLSNGHATH